ncbi:unnamed protein product [Anisakis simplex]|uniref:Rho-GAP domain-containing protein n=1 Tax=Anisakis simplex TaxID=6269 RepID=A0A0M3IYM4_ANISI|nr:unnamed protein product [Anisakis simplex]
MQPKCFIDNCEQNRIRSERKRKWVSLLAGLREQGLYRNCGVTSKVQKLMQVGLDKRRATSNEKLNFIDDVEWETKTVSSAIKTFLRNLPEPLMTFDLHSQFINAAKMDSATRVSHIHYYVHQLPKTHFDMLRLVIEHLKKVADRSSDNLMTVGNLGVCFGPTLLRPKEETMAAIMDIKFCNVVVEVLIANCDLIFNTQPSNIDGVPCPPKPVHRNDSNVVAEGISSSPSAVPFLDVVPSSFHKQSSVSPSADKRFDSFVRSHLHSFHDKFHGSSSSSLPGVVAGGNRPRSIGNSTARQRPPHIYDRVATSFIDSQSDANLNSPPRLLPSYGKASTSAGASPVSPTASTVALSISQSAVASSTVPKSHHAMKRATNSQVSAGGNGRQRSAQYYHHQQQDTRTESSDSLNSVASGCSVDASPPLSSTRHQLSMDTGSALLSSREPRAAGGSASSASKAKMSASYAPAYNPFACESWNESARVNNDYMKLIRSLSVDAMDDFAIVIVDSSSNNKNKNKNLGYLGISSAFTATPNERLNGGSSSKKYSRNASSPATTGTAVSPHRSLNSTNSTNHACSQNVMMALSELRISPLFSYSHPLRSLQPSRRVKTLYSCTAGHDTELSFKPGQIITNVYESKEEGWLVGTLNGKTGLIPANYVEPLP